MAKKIKFGAILPPDTFFYTIPFEQPGQKLSREILGKHYPVPKGRRGHMGIHTEYKSFQNGLIGVEVKTPDSSENRLLLHVRLTELDVACTCGMPERKLCYHAYMGLHSLAWYHYLELDKYYWPGFTANDTIRNKFLTTEIHKEGISVKPKAKYGNIFRSSIGFAGAKQLSIQKPAIREAKEAGGQEVVAYCLAYNLGHHANSILPVLMPCLGITNKNNKEVASFKQFVSADKSIQNIQYSPDQELLNKISAEQYAIAKAYDEFDGEEKTDKSSKLKQDILTLWEQALPLILHEKYTYTYYTYWLKYLKSKPRKADIGDYRLSSERPVLSFVLKLYQDHFSLTAVLSIDGVPLKPDHKPQLFVFNNTTHLSYLMPSVQDDNLFNWIWTHYNRLTILKEHFLEFHSMFLEKITSCYEVSFIDPKSKKAMAYSIEMIYNEVLK